MRFVLTVAAYREVADVAQCGEKLQRAGGLRGRHLGLVLRCELRHCAGVVDSRPSVIVSTVGARFRKPHVVSVLRGERSLRDTARRATDGPDAGSFVLVTRVPRRTMRMVMVPSLHAARYSSARLGSCRVFMMPNAPGQLRRAPLCWTPLRIQHPSAAAAGRSAAGRIRGAPSLPAHRRSADPTPWRRYTEIRSRIKSRARPC